MKFEKINITPSMAAGFLKNNPMNRKLKKRIVASYAVAMKNGDWKEDSPEVISFSGGGVLIDGQHRLNAIVVAQVPVTMWVATDVPKEVFVCLNQGAKRTTADIFGIKGVSNENLTAATIKAYLKIKSGVVLYGSSNSEDKVYTEFLLNTYMKSPEYWQQIVQEGEKFYKDFMKIIPPSFICAYYAAFCDVDKVQAKQFMERLTTGVGIVSNTDPIKLLRTHFLKQQSSYKKTTPYFNNVVFIKAWNAFREKRLVHQLTFKKDEKLPKIV